MGPSGNVSTPGKVFSYFPLVRSQSTGDLLSFVLRVPGLEEGVMFGGYSIGIVGRHIDWMPGMPGARRANVPS